MDCIILWRNTQNGVVSYISDEEHEDQPAVFENMDEAINFALESKLLQAFPYQIVDLDEL